jgi:hypothetical protein
VVGRVAVGVVGAVRWVLRSAAEWTEPVARVVKTVPYTRRFEDTPYASGSVWIPSEN